MTPQQPRPCGVGCRLTRLLKFIGIPWRKGCQCKAHAAEMDREGVAWCKENIETTLFWMREEAKEQGLTFIESQARWLVRLAIRLAEEGREPNRGERIRLQAMRVGNKVLNG